MLSGLLVGGVVFASCQTPPPATELLPSAGVGDRVDTPGGTIHALSLGPVAAWDPQRIGSRDEMAFASRVFARTLTTYAVSTAAEGQSKVVPDLATTTGTPDVTLKKWTFTLRDGVKWQDGSAVTCADVAYGISRSFATKEITGGPTDAMAVLAVPRKVDGTSTYAGPYDVSAANKAGQAAFDKAVACTGKNLVFTLSVPVSDFNEMVTLPAWGPVKRSADRGASAPYAVFSAGPYMLKGAWTPSVGGTWVRNPHWSRESDEVRTALPNEIRAQEGLETQTVAQQIMADGTTGRASIALGSAPPALQQQITAVQALRDRSVNPRTGLVDYLVPNVKSTVMAKEPIRLALAASTNRDAYVTAIGGATSADPVLSLIPEPFLAAHEGDPVGVGTKGDPVKAAAILATAKIKTPVTIRIAYRSSDSSDKALAALLPGWQAAGFEPELVPISEDYFTAISAPEMAKKVDVFWSNWAPAWASASTILPPLFESTINVTAEGPGRDYGYWADPETNAAIAKVGACLLYTSPSPRD